MLANQNVLKWVHDFEILDLDEQNRKQFLLFANDFAQFKASPDYDRVRIHCHEIESIYFEYLAAPLRKLLATNSRDHRHFKIWCERFH
jgi:hypothetical protein